MNDFSLKVFLLKVKARCNLNCSYCYEFNSPDQSWKAHPATMSLEVVRQTAERIAGYVAAHRLETISIVFHGGEPLLAPPEWYAAAFRMFDQLLPGGVHVNYGLQTNGILLNEVHLDIFKRHHVSIGISLDGTRTANDKHRVDFSGRSSFDKVLKGIALLRQPLYASIPSGLLTVIAPSNEPLETYRFLSSLGIPSMDFLFPHYHYASPPPFPAGIIGKWLTRIFDEWWEADSSIQIRLFQDIIHLMLGGKYSAENMGLAPVELIVIQTDGSYEAVDSLKSTFDGAVFTGKHVASHDFDEVMSHELIRQRLDRATHLPSQCKKCSFRDTCGGGYIPHRYSRSNGFDNPSIYCEDLKILLGHISDTLVSSLPETQANRISHA